MAVNENFSFPVTQGHGEEGPGGLCQLTQGHGERQGEGEEHPGGLAPPDVKTSSKTASNYSRHEQPTRPPPLYTSHNLHVVLVAANRFRITSPEKLGQIRDAAIETAAVEGHRIAALSVMPDHIHLALRGNIDNSPEQIALGFQNRLALAAGCRLWQDGFYVGTFSEYDLDVVRRMAKQS
jgi:REP element-mobilizing transposase RayT